MRSTTKRRGPAARRPSRRVGAIAASCALAALLAGCGSGSSTTASETAASSSGAGGAAGSGAGLITPGSGTPKPTATPAVASVSGTPIAKSAYEHWRAVDRATGAKGNVGHRALAFLITSSWVLGEAAHRHATVTESEVTARLAALEHKSFPKKGQLSAFLKRSKETPQDLQMRVKVEMLSGLIQGEVRAKAAKGHANAALAAFERQFKARWRARTSCNAAYVMEDCKQYKGPGEPQLSERSTGSASAKAGSTSASGSGSTSTPGSSSSSAGGEATRSATGSSGEVYSAPGAFSVQSPAFTRNGPIPAKYTCDGTGTSPPLQLRNVPKKAAEIVLFVIDDTNSTSTGGIRWMLGAINPATRTIAAGQTPPGAIVGANGEGKAAYGPICPAKGKTDTIEIVAYALKKPIKLSPGFQPSLAESEYGSTKDLLGEAAVTYATYHRP